MRPFSWARVVLAGLAAGVVINSLGYVFAIEEILDGPAFAKPWADAIQALNHPSFTPTNFIAIQQIWGFLTGIVVMWLSARARATPQGSAFPWMPVLTAWGLTSLIWCAVLYLEKIPLSPLAIIVGLPEIALGALMGRWIDREVEAVVAQSAREGSHE